MALASLVPSQLNQLAGEQPVFRKAVAVKSKIIQEVELCTKSGRQGGLHSRYLQNIYIIDINREIT